MLQPPIEPMLAKPIGTEVDVATGPDVAFEPKWDGFRALLFRSEEGVVLQGRGRSRGGPDEVVDLAYAFPELVAAALAQIGPGTVIDGEIVVAKGGRLDFTALSSRLRPRSEAGGASIARLAATLPASFLAFDVLWSGIDRMAMAFADRRLVLEDLAQSWVPPLLLTPATRDPALAREWFTRFESAGIDGLIVKPVGDPYAPGKRAQGKIKHLRTADVVVAGWRAHTRPGADGGAVVGSLLLGLHDGAGVLQYVGVASAFTAATRADLVGLLAPHAIDAAEAHPWRGATDARVPGAASRWGAGQPWTALRPELVAEVTYDQLEGDRFRHVAGFLRWRPDRAPDSCSSDQLEIPQPARIGDLLGLEGRSG